jgi:hypothetical protein
MRVVFGISLVLFAICFIAVFAYNNFSGDKIVVKPPYFFNAGDAVSQVNSVAFVFFFSLLAFGLSTTVAMGIEGAKFASLFSTGAIGGYDLLFIIPEALAAFAACELGQAILNDYEGKSSLFKNTKFIIASLAGSVILLVAFILGRGFAGGLQ